MRVLSSYAVVVAKGARGRSDNRALLEHFWTFLSLFLAIPYQLNIF